MKYELWDVVSYGDGEAPMPFTLIERANSFSEIYAKFVQENKKRPCVVFLKDEKEDTAKIYESPDGGKTVYERDFLDYDRKNRKRIK